MSIKRALTLGLLAALILSLSLSIGKAPEQFVYLLQAPPVAQDAPEGGQQAGNGADEQDEAAARKKLSPLQQMLKSLDSSLEEMSTALSAYGVTAYASGQALSDGLGGSATAGLKGIWGKSLLEPEQTLVFGRQLYHEEVDSGAAVAVIDEQLAISLYRVGDPLGRTLHINGHPFRVVGITRHSRHVGEVEVASARIPLLALDQAKVQMQVLSVQLRPIPGAGAYAALSQALKQWQSQGSFHSLSKEKYRAMLPLRLLLCAMGLMLFALTIRLSKAATLALYEGGKRKLQSRYAKGLLPEFAGRGLLIILMYAANLGLIFLVLTALIAPVYTFPEWVPTVLVEPKDIIKTFWDLRTQESSLIAFRTPELLRLRFLHRLMALACGIAGVLLLKPWHRLKSRLFPATYQ